MMLKRQNKELKVKFEVKNSNRAKAKAAIGGLQMGEAAHVFSRPFMLLTRSLGGTPPRPRPAPAWWHHSPPSPCPAHA
jgi:hypothetical protein